MKSLTQYINEAISNTIQYKGFEFKLDVNMAQNKKAAGKNALDMEMASHFDSLKDLDCKSLLKQGCKWIVALPPHDCSGGKVDYWQIYMFVKSKKVADMFNCEGIRAVYDLKKQEIVNKDKIKWEAKDYKAIRMD